MTTKSRKSSAGKGGNAKPQAQNQLKNAEKPAFVSRYIGIDSHLTERNGSTEQVFGIAAESDRPGASWLMTSPVCATSWTRTTMTS